MGELLAGQVLTLLYGITELVNIETEIARSVRLNSEPSTVEVFNSSPNLQVSWNVQLIR